MIAKLKKINFDNTLKAFLHEHPVAGTVTLFVGLPMFMIASVAASATAVVFPLALMMGWL